MLRKLLLSILVLGGANAFAQADKNTSKPPEMEYKLPGSPMPKLLLVKSVDTSKPVTTANTPDNKEVAEDQGRKGRKKKDKAHGGKQSAQQLYTTNEDLDNGANLFVMMFNPTCSHCEDETRMLEQNMDLFKKSKLVLVANKGMSPYMPNFVRSNKVADYPSIYVGTDSIDFISKIFLYSALPQINIYDHKRNLIKTYTGEVALDSLKRYIE